MFDEALTQYETALALNPHHAETRTSLGTLFLLQDRPDKAVAEHKRALESKPDYVEAYNNLGVALLELGMSDEAVVCHEHALALKPNFPEAKFGLCMAQLPVLYAEEREINARRARYQNCSSEALWRTTHRPGRGHLAISPEQSAIVSRST